MLTEFLVSSDSGVNGGPVETTAGPDGNLWFTDYFNIGRITPQGAVTEFPIGSEATDITAGPDGNLWVAQGTQVGRITTAGVVTEFGIPSMTGSYAPTGITSGPDGNLWIAQYSYVSRVTPAGVVTGFSPGAGATRITSAPNGNLAFSTLDGIGEIDHGWCADPRSERGQHRRRLRRNHHWAGRESVVHRDRGEQVRVCRALTW